MSASFRPVYVPRSQRKRQRNETTTTSHDSEHHNATTTSIYGDNYTATTAPPSAALRRVFLPAAQQQDEEDDTNNMLQENTIHDIMDDRDYNEWAGPNAVNATYTNVKSVTASDPHIGKRLLLQWKATAYKNDANAYLLSVEMTRPVLIPEPKFDTNGLGYSAWGDELSDVRDYTRRQRQRQSQQYHANDLVGSNKTGGDSTTIAIMDNAVDSNRVSHSSSGFALRDDDDADVYNNDDSDVVESNKYQLAIYKKDGSKKPLHTDTAMSEYNSVAYDSEHDDNAENVAGNKHDLGVGSALPDLLQKWATSTTTTEPLSNDGDKHVKSASTSQAWHGFVRGGAVVAATPPAGRSSQNGSETSNKANDLYTKEAKLHVFAPQDHPLVWQTLCRADQDVRAEKKLAERTNEALQSQAMVQPRQQAKSVIAANVTAAMQSRFTASTSADDTKDPDNGDSDTTNKPLNISRTVTSFIPDRLWCKRWNVVPQQMSELQLTVKSSDRNDTSTEPEWYKNVRKEAQKVASSSSSTTPSRLDLIAVDPTMQEHHPLQKRPSDSYYNQVYNARTSSYRKTVSKDGTSESQVLIDEARDEQKTSDATTRDMVVYEPHLETAGTKDPNKLTSTNINASRAANDGTDNDNSSENNDRDRKRHRKLKSKRRRSYDDSDDDGGASSVGSRRHHRKREHKKHKKRSKDYHHKRKKKSHKRP